ncbi:MAG TPA: STAS domain-containing protein [Spirochaetota bacterium]|nr:STAS domain-containing protein [Spirochaetota bacterium]HPJ33818.1 STAS domain-containing protein [Spirochaetota bacterium]
MKVENEINVKNIREFYLSLKNELEKSDEIIIDFSDTVRIDSSAAQVLLSAMKRAAELDKQIKMEGVSPELQVLLTLAGLSQL